MRQRLTCDRNSFHVLLHLSNVVLGRVIVRLSLSIHVILDHVRSRRVLLRHFSTSNRLYGFTSTIAKAPLPKVATPTSDTQVTQGQRWCTRRLAGDYIFRKSRGATWMMIKSSNHSVLPNGQDIFMLRNFVSQLKYFKFVKTMTNQNINFSALTSVYYLSSLIMLIQFKAAPKRIELQNRA